MNINDTVRDYIGPTQVYNPFPSANKSDALSGPGLLALFETPHNRTITWDNLLRQTSDWEGTLWGKPDWADRPGPDPATWTNRARNKAGSVYKYITTRGSMFWRSPPSMSGVVRCRRC